MAAKPVIESSYPLSVEESRALVSQLGKNGLTRDRKAVLCSYAAAVQKAFQKGTSRK